MGFDKALLPFGNRTMLETVVGILANVVDQIVVVSNPAIRLPHLPDNVQLVHDQRPGYGPLEGIRVGLSAISDQCEMAFITACDSPLLRPQLVEQMFVSLGDHQVAVPIDGEFTHPLAAVYRTNVLETIHQLQAANQHRPVSLFERVKTRRIPVAELRNADAELSSFQNFNQPEAYLTLLKQCGLECPPEILEQLEKQQLEKYREIN